MENSVYQCYGIRSTLIWVAVEYIYLIVIQVAAFVLAILNRKVMIKTLNDTKETMIIVYTTSTIMLILGIVLFARSNRYILNEVLISGLIMLATTVLITFVFVPKVKNTKNRLGSKVSFNCIVVVSDIYVS